jgi:hypothetical protein
MTGILMRSRQYQQRQACEAASLPERFMGFRRPRDEYFQIGGISL